MRRLARLANSAKSIFSVTSSGAGGIFSGRSVLGFYGPFVEIVCGSVGNFVRAAVNWHAVFYFRRSSSLDGFLPAWVLRAARVAL